VFDVSRLPEEFQAEPISASTGTEHDPPGLVAEGTFRAEGVLRPVGQEPPQGIEATRSST
jgi:hypothetical protein